MAYTAEELVVLVDGHNVVIGTAAKATVHTDQTPLHRAFSLFLFNENGEILLQQRSYLKKTWPLMWSNSCCGHPAPEETIEQAIRRRTAYELGVTEVEALQEILPEFAYRAEHEGVVENEICPVWMGATKQSVAANPAEVETYKWLSWEAFVQEIQNYPDRYSEWCRWEVEELVKKIVGGEIRLPYISA